MVTDTALQKAGVVRPVQEAIQATNAQMCIFDEGEPEPSTDLVMRAVEAATEFQPDLFVAVGGGSNIDLTKASCAAFAHGVDAQEMFGFNLVPGPIPTLVCLPTTAGTGSEMSQSSVLKNSANGKKASVLSQYLRPDFAIVDPLLTMSCPRTVTAQSGIDALTHAIEAYLAIGFDRLTEDPVSGRSYEGNHPIGDLYAEKAIRLVAQHLRSVFEEPASLTNRTQMCLAATLAGAAFSNCGVVLAHALEYPIGAAYRCPHGAGNGIVLPEVMRFWLPERRSRMARIAELMGVDGATAMEEQEAAEAAIDAVISLRETVELPAKLSEIGAKAEDIPELAAAAFSLKRLLALSPRTTSLEDLTKILESCF